ncbi:hypothetical protein BC826DRAFT_1178943 [Russula brevipes]|nr:hypothetical protein BC826DRAFT_1178943 [Russula brevipes]
MPRPSAARALGQSRSHPFDIAAFLKYMDDYGRAYRNQAMELIDLFRLFVLAASQHFAQDAELSDVSKVCDDALSCAAQAREETTQAADQAFKQAIRKLHEYELKFHPPNPNNVENTVRKRMESAKQKDEEKLEPSTWTRAMLSRFSLIPPKRQRTRTLDASSTVVEFRLLRSLTDTEPTIVRQVLTDGSKLQEILWNFSRFPGERRVMLAQNPHFYIGLDKLADARCDGFATDPIECYLGVNTHPRLYVLTNMLGRVFLELGEDQRRAFDNIWKTNKILIFKDVCGKLEGESIVGVSLQGKNCLWCHVELPGVGPAMAMVSPNSSSPPSMTTSSTDTPAWEEVEDWKVPIQQAMDSPNVKIRIAHSKDLSTVANERRYDIHTDEPA